MKPFRALPCGVHETTSPTRRSCAICARALEAIRAELDAPLNFAQQMARVARAKWSNMTLEEHQAWLAEQPSALRRTFAKLQREVQAYQAAPPKSKYARRPKTIVLMMQELHVVQEIPIARIAKLSGVSYATAYTWIKDTTWGHGEWPKKAS